MNRALLLAGLTVASVALAIPGSNRWPLDSCTTTCRVRATNQTSQNQSCLSNRCFPEVRSAAAIWNRDRSTGAVSSSMVLNGAQQIPYATVLQGIQASAARWSTSNTGLSCGTSMRFDYQGTFASPTGQSAINGNDGNNNVIYLGGSFWRHGSGTLGVTITFSFPGEITDADMELNNNTPWASDGRQSAIDYESVLTHEFGHFIGFDHTVSGNAVMNPSVANGVVKRNLLAPDQNDLCSVYPGQAGGQGAPCTSASMCTGGRVCEGPSGSTSLICTQDCAAAGASCPSGFSCQASTSGFACLPQLGAADLCRFCTAGADCSTGRCITDGNGFNWCSASCNASVANSCGAGYQCQTVSSGESVCVPTNGCSNQCTTATVAQDCAPGYACQGGECTPTGNPGDRCEVSGVCNSCSFCIPDDQDPNIGFCRSCCNALGECMGCTQTTCGAGLACTGFSNPAANPERVCYPSSGATLCQPCGTSTPCQAGLACIAGTCRSQCNPTNPGTCQACLATSTAVSPSGGICVCTPNEAVSEGGACSTGTAAPLRVCRTGLRCAGGTCRTPCNPAAAVPCATGFACTAVSGQNVCVPSGGTGGGGAGAGGGVAGGASGVGGGVAGGASGVGGGVSGARRRRGWRRRRRGWRRLGRGWWRCRRRFDWWRRGWWEPRRRRDAGHGRRQRHGRGPRPQPLRLRRVELQRVLQQRPVRLHPLGAAVRQRRQRVPRMWRQRVVQRAGAVRGAAAVQRVWLHGRRGGPVGADGAGAVAAPAAGQAELMRRWGPIAVVGVLSMSCLSGGLAGALGVAAVDHVQNTERTPTVSFENRHSEPVCGINLWRPSQPESESDANWLELTDLLKLEPGQRVTVGIVPKDGAYRLRALGCGARGFSLSDVVIPQVVPGTTLVLGAPEPAPVRAPLPSTVGL